MKRSSNIDADALSKIKELGVNPANSQEMEFFLYFPHESNAWFAAAALANMRFKTSVEISESGQWLCMAMKTMKPAAERLEDLRNWMEELAERFNGEYDGWGYGIALEEETRN